MGTYSINLNQARTADAAPVAADADATSINPRRFEDVLLMLLLIDSGKTSAPSTVTAIVVSAA